TRARAAKGVGGHGRWRAVGHLERRGGKLRPRKPDLSLEQHRGISTTIRLGGVTAVATLVMLAFAGTAFAHSAGAPCPAWTQPPAPAPSRAGAKPGAGSKATATAGVLERSSTAVSGSIVYTSKGISVGPTKLLVRATIAQLEGSVAVIEYGRGATLSSCGPVE